MPNWYKSTIYDYKNQQWANTETMKHRYGGVLEPSEKIKLY